MEDKYSFFIPIDVEESVSKTQEDKGSKDVFVKGFASTPHLDLQGEIVNPIGVGIDYFKKHGWINYEHKQDSDYVMGEPTDNCYIDPEKGLYIEAKLYMDNPHTQSIWKLAKSMQKAGSKRKLGFSIEGSVKKRNKTSKHVIEEMMITNVAITKSPANPNATWDMFVKSMTATGHDINPETQTNGAALRGEQLGQAVRRLANTYKDTNNQEVWKEAIEFLSKDSEISAEESIVLLQVYKGLSRTDASEYVQNNKEPKGEH